MDYLYPLFQPTPVGLSPGRMKMLSPDDLKSLCDAFQILTDKDPLGDESVTDQFTAWLGWKMEHRR